MENIANTTVNTTEVLTKQQLAQRLNVSIDTVARAEKKGTIKGFRVAGRRSSVRFLWPNVLVELQNQAR